MPLISCSICTLSCSGSKLFPAFRQFLMATLAEEAEKKAALLAELAVIDAYLAKHVSMYS